MPDSHRVLRIFVQKSAPTLAAGFLLFAVMGAAQGLYGPAIPELRARFGGSAGQVGLVVSAHFTGAVVGMVLWALAAPRRRLGLLASASTMTLAGGCLMFAYVGSLPLAFVAAGLIGLGYGALNVCFNSLFSRLPGASAGRLNALGGCFGIGALAGPMMSGAFGGVTIPYVVIGGLALALVAVPIVARTSVQASLVDEPKRPLHVPSATGFIALFVLCIALESATGGWATTHLLASGLSVGSAAAWTGAFWASMAAGRLIGAPFLRSMPPGRVVTVTLTASIAGLSLMALGERAGIGYIVAGLAFAPVFPTTVAWFSQRMGVDQRRLGVVLAVGYTGGVLGPAFVGWTVDAFGASVIPLALFALLAGELLSAWSLRRGDRAAPAGRSLPHDV